MALKVTRDSVMWGKRRENGIWLAAIPRRRFMHPGNTARHDSVFIAIGRLRIRIIVRDIHGEREYERKRQDERTVLPW